MKTVALVGAGLTGASKALITAYRQAELQQMREVATANLEPGQEDNFQKLFMNESYMYGEPFDGSGLNGLVVDPLKNRKQRRKEATIDRRKWRLK